MRRAVYNSAIPDNRLKSVNWNTLGVRAIRFTAFFVLLTAIAAQATDWSSAEQQLALKIAAVTGPGTVALSIDNRSSLGSRDSEIVQNGLRTALGQAGIHFVKSDQAVASVGITLSQNVTSYVWVAQIRQSAGESSVVMVSLPRSGWASTVHDSMPITLRKTLLWSQSDPILDVCNPGREWCALAHRCAQRRECFILPDARREVASRAGTGNHPRQAMAARPARKASAGERPSSGCISPWSDLQNQCERNSGNELPRERRSVADGSGRDAWKRYRVSKCRNVERTVAGNFAGVGVLCSDAQLFHRRSDACGGEV